MVTKEDGRNFVIIDKVSLSACARRGSLCYRATSDGKLSLRPLSKGKKIVTLGEEYLVKLWEAQLPDRKDVDSQLEVVIPLFWLLI